MHFIDTSLGNIGANAIVGAGLPIAVGAALAFKLQGKPHGALTFFGDGATNIGTFHEALNMAAVWKTPVVFIITNNLYGEYSPQMTTTATRRPGAARRPVRRCPASSWTARTWTSSIARSRPALDRAAAGDGPSLLEMKTYRYRGHSRTDPAKYRAPGELEEWKKRDPINILGAKLARRGGCCWRPRSRSRSASRPRRTSMPPPSEPREAPILTLEETRQYVYAD